MDEKPYKTGRSLAENDDLADLLELTDVANLFAQQSGTTGTVPNPASGAGIPAYNTRLGSVGGGSQQHLPSYSQATLARQYNSTHYNNAGHLNPNFRRGPQNPHPVAPQQYSGNQVCSSIGPEINNQVNQNLTSFGQYQQSAAGVPRYTSSLSRPNTRGPNQYQTQYNSYIKNTNNNQNFNLAEARRIIKPFQTNQGSTNCQVQRLSKYTYSEPPAYQAAQRNVNAAKNVPDISTIWTQKQSFPGGTQHHGGESVISGPQSPAFIKTDFSKDLFAEAEAQLKRSFDSSRSIRMDLSKQGEGAPYQQQPQQTTPPTAHQPPPRMATAPCTGAAPRAHTMALVGQPLMVQPAHQPQLQLHQQTCTLQLQQQLAIQQQQLQIQHHQHAMATNNSPQATPLTAHFTPLQFSSLAQMGMAQPVSSGDPNAPISLSLMRPQQMKGISQPVQVSIAQGSPVGTSAASQPQASFINMSCSSIQGASLMSQPIHMLSTSSIQQMVSSVPVQLSAEQGGGTVLVPFQQPASLMQQQAQVITSLNKSLQAQASRPGLITLPATIQPSLLAQHSKPGFPVTVNTTGATITIPMASLVTANQLQQARPPHLPTITSPQLLNIPRLHLTTSTKQGTPEVRPTLILQPPIRSPEKTSPMITQIRPTGGQFANIRSPEAKIIAISPQLLNANPGAAMLLSPPRAVGGDGLNVSQQLHIPQLAAAPLIKQTSSATSTEAITTLSPSRVEYQSPKILASVGATVNSVTATPSQGLSSDSTSTATPTPSLTQSNGSKTDHYEKSKSNLEKQPTQTKEAIPVEFDDPDFVWDDYLEETGHQGAPETSFAHVECSLRSRIEKGMVVEVTKNVAGGSYWLASIVLASGPLLRLRYAGAEDGGQDFWLDLGSTDLHHVGWGAVANKAPQPPQVLKDKLEDPESFLVKTLKESPIVPACLLDSSHGVNAVEQIKPGQRLEVQGELGSVWVARIMENVGGRLLLRYEGTDRAAHDFWLFYLDFKLHPIGWSKDHSYHYKPPDVIKGEHENYAEWSESLQLALKEASENVLTETIFQDQERVMEHSFQEGMKLEALHPLHRAQLCPATVIRVERRYFMVQIDSLDPRDDKARLSFLCHGRSANIFPVGWCQGNGLRITTPNGWKLPEFDWDTYLASNAGTAAPESVFRMDWPEHEFERGMKLEVVNPSQPGQICAGSITRTIDHVMWIHLDSCAKIMANHILPLISHDIFPPGWCASNGYPLKPPRKTNTLRRSRVAIVQPERAETLMSADEFRSATYTQIKAGDGGGNWCPKIYFNHRCFSGPFLSKGRIAELPRCVGPGPIQLVLKEVLSMLINVAYKSSRVLREIQLEGPPESSMSTQTLKAKYKGKSYCAVVELCKMTSQIEQYCREVCIKLECCPNLFSPNFVNGNCPENCSQLTKTKYTYYYGKKKKRKVGRPPGGHTNLEHGAMKAGKKRKRKRLNLISHKKSSPEENEPSTPLDNLEEDMFDDDRSSKSTDTSSLGNNDHDFDHQAVARKKRKYQHKILPPSLIKTRGAKLPKYSFERRTHKKIMLANPPSHRRSSPPEADQSAIVSSSKSAQPKYKSEDILKLSSNPLHWSVMDVVKFMKTTDCAHMARAFLQHAIDGQAFLLLTLPAVQEHLDLKLGPAIKLCHHIERVKVAFYEQFAK